MRDHCNTRGSSRVETVEKVEKKEEKKVKGYLEDNGTHYKDYEMVQTAKWLREGTLMLKNKQKLQALLEGK